MGYAEEWVKPKDDALFFHLVNPELDEFGNSRVVTLIGSNVSKSLRAKSFFQKPAFSCQWTEENEKSLLFRSHVTCSYMSVCSITVILAINSPSKPFRLINFKLSMTLRKSLFPDKSLSALHLRQQKQESCGND